MKKVYDIRKYKRRNEIDFLSEHKDKSSQKQGIKEKKIVSVFLCICLIFASAFAQNTKLEAKKADTKTQVTVEESDKDKIIIGIDPGHQLHGNSALEPIGPGASTKKAKVSSGTSGVSTGVPEYKLNLVIARKVKKELEKRGYEVVMTRNKNNVDISNQERAQKMNKKGADICVRLHADGSDSSSVSGASALYPSKSNPYVGALSKKSLKLAKAVLGAYTKATHIRDRGCVKRDDLTGTNWSEIPVIVLEMGFMSNPTEDKNMQKKKFQKKMVQGICDGIDAYYE